MAENKNIEVGGRLHSIATGNVLAGANEIFDDDKNKKQSEINTETYSLVNDVNERLSGLSPDQQSALSVAAKATNNEVKLGYYVCDTAAATAEKVISDATGYVLSLGGSIKIKMTNANTAANATLNINSTGAKPLYYDGERTSANNSWKAGETVEVYYDGTSYYANNVAGGSSDGVFDVSAKYPTSGVEGGNTYTLEGALAVLNTNLSSNKKKGGMSIKFVQSSDSKYVQYRLMANSWSRTITDWQGVDDNLTADSNNFAKSGSVFEKVHNISGYERNAVFDFSTGSTAQSANRKEKYSFKKGYVYRIEVLTNDDVSETYFSVRDSSGNIVNNMNGKCRGKGSRYDDFVCSADGGVYLYMSLQDEGNPIVYNVVITNLTDLFAYSIAVNNKEYLNLFGVIPYDVVWDGGDGYIGYDDGLFHSSTTWKVSSGSISLNQGDVIFVYTKGSGTRASVISVINNNTYIPKVLSTGQRTFYYQIEASCNVVLSKWIGGDSIETKVYIANAGSTLSLISKHLKDIDIDIEELEHSINGTNEKIENFQFPNKAFIEYGIYRVSSIGAPYCTRDYGGTDYWESVNDRYSPILNIGDEIYLSNYSNRKLRVLSPSGNIYVKTDKTSGSFVVTTAGKHYISVGNIGTVADTDLRGVLFVKANENVKRIVNKINELDDFTQYFDKLSDAIFGSNKEDITYKVEDCIEGSYALEVTNDIFVTPETVMYRHITPFISLDGYSRIEYKAREGNASFVVLALYENDINGKYVYKLDAFSDDELHDGVIELNKYPNARFVRFAFKDPFKTETPQYFKLVGCKPLSDINLINQKVDSLESEVHTPYYYHMYNWMFVSGTIYEGNYSRGANNSSSNLSCLTYFYIGKQIKKLYFRYANRTDGNTLKIRICFYDDTKTYISQKGYAVINDISVPANAKYFRIALSLQNSSNVGVPLNREDIAYNELLISHNVVHDYELANRYGHTKTDITDINTDDVFINRLTQLKWRFHDGGTVGNNVLVLAHFSDIHGSGYNLGRIIYWVEHNNSYIDDIIHTGDCVQDKFTDGVDFWTGIKDSENVLQITGNHDYNTTGSEPITQSQVYNMMFKDNISNWDVTSAGEGLCYWYKDYASCKIRLIGVDCIRFDASQQAWLETVLSGAKTAGYSVVIATHTSPGPITAVKCAFNTSHLSPGTNYWGTEMIAIVQDFIDNGGEFVCYMGGHTHRDIFGYLTNNPMQTVYLVDTARMDNYWTDHQSIHESKCADLFNIVGFDTTAKTISILRVGNDCDKYMRHIGQMCWNYQNMELLSSW